MLSKIPILPSTKLPNCPSCGKNDHTVQAQFFQNYQSVAFCGRCDASWPSKTITFPEFRLKFVKEEKQ